MLPYVIGALLVIAILYFITKPKKKLDKTDFKNIHAVELATLLRQSNIQLIDVRTAAEVATGKIANAINVPLGPSMKEDLQNFDKSKPYIVYCRTGRRSELAAKTMIDSGFTDVKNLTGGITAYHKLNPQ